MRKDDVCDGREMHACIEVEKSLVRDACTSGERTWGVATYTVATWCVVSAFGIVWNARVMSRAALVGDELVLNFLGCVGRCGR